MGSPALDPRDRRARVATAALFLTNGALFAGLLPRYPEIKSELGLSNTVFGLAVASFSAGALLTGPGRGVADPAVPILGRRRRRQRADRRLDSGRRACAQRPRARAGAVRCRGGGLGHRRRQNVHGLRVQRRYGRFIINSLHAVGRWARSLAV